MGKSSEFYNEVCGNYFKKGGGSPELVAHAEIRRMVVKSQPWANNSGEPISKKPITKSGD
jgi:hypothetical protein